jgi:serine/threonine protein kinase
MKIFIKGNPVTVDVRKSLGKGMEADVYRLGDLAVKIFKGPNHPDLLTDFDRDAARNKIEEHQRKLNKFPRNLPAHVVSPIDLVEDSSGKIVGYTMNMVDNPRQARVFGQVSERTGIDPNQIVGFFTDLHFTVKGLHTARVVIGDFNDLNILVCNKEAYIIDADSFQFGEFPCRMYTEEFVDPRLCNQNGKTAVLSMTHDPDSDWYSYAVMLFKLLLCVGPFGGVYKPSSKKDLILHTQRSLRGISVFNPEVVYPKKAIHYKVLPDDILDFFQKTFEQRQRIEFPVAKLLNLQWKKCDVCGNLHARQYCPDCKIEAPISSVKERIEVSGKIKSTMVFRTFGDILYSTIQNGQLKWVYSENGKLFRENRISIANGSPNPGMRFRIHEDNTAIGQGNTIVVLKNGSAPVQLFADQFQDKFAMFDASAAGIFLCQNGSLLRCNKMGLEYESDRIGQVLEGQTLFWVGDIFGFGFYRAGEVCVSFVFDAKSKVINDSVVIPRFGGQLIGVRCVFSANRAAIFFAFKDGPKVTNRCVLIKSSGDVIGIAEASEGDGSWLSGIRGKCIIGDGLLATTDDGIIKVDFANGVVSKESKFEGSEKFVDSGSHLFAVKDGLFCVGNKQISLLQIVR